MGNGLFKMTQDELRAVLLQLEQAAYNHELWYDGLIRTIVCHLQHDRHDADKDSHRECRIGQWYYNHAPEKLRDHAGFIALGVEHERMHHLAAELRTEASSGITQSSDTAARSS